MRQVNKRTAGHPSCYLYTSDTSTRRRLPFLAVVRQGYSVSKTPSYGTELALGVKKGLLRYATHFQRHSVLKNRLLRYGREIRYRKHPSTVRNEATGCGHCVASSDPRMRPLRSGLWLEDATTVGVVPAAGTTLLLLPMGPVLTASWERFSGYNATTVSSDSHCGGSRETPTRCGHYQQPDVPRELPHSEKRHSPREAVTTPKHPLTNQKINSQKHPQPKNALSPPKKRPLTTGPRQRLELQ